MTTITFWSLNIAFSSNQAGYLMEGRENPRCYTSKRSQSSNTTDSNSLLTLPCKEKARSVPVGRHGASRVKPIMLEYLVLSGDSPPVRRREASKLPLDFPRRVYHTFAERVSKLHQVQKGRDALSPGLVNATRLASIATGTSLAWETGQGSRTFSTSAYVFKSG